MDEIRVAVTQALQILKEPEMKSNHERKEFDGRLEKIIDPVFDFRAMAKRSTTSALITTTGLSLIA
jgi:ABC-type transporter MlaC component